MSDAQERTEDATAKRMKEVRSKGKLQKSQDVTAWLGIGAAGLLIPSTLAAATTETTEQLVVAAAIARNPTPEAALQALNDGLGSVMPILGAMLAAAAVAVVVGAVAQGGVHIRTQMVKFDQFNPATALSRTFGLQALWQGAKALLKTLVVGGVLYAVIQSLMPVLMTSGGLPVRAVLDAATSGSAALLIAAVVAGLVLAAVDVLVVGKKNQKQTRMTKKEVSDENKNSEGDPLIRQQRRSRQLAMSRNRMIATIAGADVVLVNPTEFAVALRYEPGKSAPKVVAKGKGIIAARIREEAAVHGIPLVKDIPLTRALHAACELGQEIPLEHYGAVAQVLTFIAALKRRGSVAGLHSLKSVQPTPERSTS
ncbi:MAG TPA: EscU/YscU/HrcU family type III secretion system export apparatus switch protein [Glaciihabitans sp.]|jgi:flagellar biosynthetic protein FlhB|nr:EscU/YscU/HrcU family type III secretion system export apparatus switch protein [Glaciihabitans sp.]